MHKATPLCVVALAACSPADAEELEAQSCLEDVDALYEERDLFVREKAREITQGVSDSDSTQARDVGASEDLSAVLGQMMAAIEDYPSLQQAQIFMEFQQELEARENRIGLAIRDCPAALESMDIDLEKPVEVVR